MVIRILSAREVNRLQEYIEKYNTAIKAADKNFYYGLLLGLTDGTNYTIDYSRIDSIGVKNTLSREAAQC